MYCALENPSQLILPPKREKNEGEFPEDDDLFGLMMRMMRGTVVEQALLAAVDTPAAPMRKMRKTTTRVAQG